jgi:hypothetical protein
MAVVTAALIEPAAPASLRRALDGFTVDAVHELLGSTGRAAQDRGDLAGVARALPSHDRLATLVRLFVLGAAVDEDAAREALHPLDLALADPLLERSADSVRARAELRPYAQVDVADRAKSSRPT